MLHTGQDAVDTDESTLHTHSLCWCRARITVAIELIEEVGL